MNSLEVTMIVVLSLHVISGIIAFIQISALPNPGIKGYQWDFYTIWVLIMCMIVGFFALYEVISVKRKASRKDWRP